MSNESTRRQTPDTGQGGISLERAQLTGNLDPAGSATALLRVFNTTTSGYANTDLEITVHDATGVAKAAEGDIVYVRRFPDSGRYEIIVDPGYKSLVRFTLDNALTTSEASESATITDQYGLGNDNDETAITVHNLLTHTAGVYVFEGDASDAGLALWDSAQNYRIIMMECP
jgi:hypothetical protein